VLGVVGVVPFGDEFPRAFGVFRAVAGFSLNFSFDGAFDVCDNLTDGLSFLPEFLVISFFVTPSSDVVRLWLLRRAEWDFGIVDVEVGRGFVREFVRELRFDFVRDNVSNSTDEVLEFGDVVPCDV
jgi:hypothetical protein